MVGLKTAERGRCVWMYSVVEVTIEGDCSSW